MKPSDMSLRCSIVWMERWSLFFHWVLGARLNQGGNTVPMGSAIPPREFVADYACLSKDCKRCCGVACVGCE